MQKDVILTGLRANSEFHLGNYLGAILPMVKLQQKYAGEYQINMFVPDLHSFTTPIDHGKLFEQTHQNLKVFVAAGLDINQPNTYIYRQSYIPAHSEMTWILDCFTGFGEASRMTEFKEKGGFRKEEAIDLLKTFDVEISEAQSKLTSREINLAEFMILLGDIKHNHLKIVEEKRKEEVSVGLFNYPVLMAADILLYGAKWVPVGEDQRQHVEFARNIAERINNKFGDMFVIPEDNDGQMKFAGLERPIRIRSLRHPTKKMSKSVDDPSGTIMLSDSPDDAFKKIMNSTTDSKSRVAYTFNAQPGISNLIQILALLKGVGLADMAKQYEGQTNYLQLKQDTANEVKSFLTDLQIKIAKVDDAKLAKKLEVDEDAMRKIADATLLKVQKAVGLRPAN